jgi:hypothetical protein
MTVARGTFNLPTDSRKSILACEYAEIFSLSVPPEIKTEHSSDDLGGEVAQGPGSEYPNIHPGQMTCDIEQEAGEQGE